jgi:hypothetical protein
LGCLKINWKNQKTNRKIVASLCDYQYICTLINHKQTNETMKKIIFLLAVAGMFALASCNSGTKTDATATDTTAVKAAADTTAAPAAADTTKAK